MPRQPGPGNPSRCPGPAARARARSRRRSERACPASMVATITAIGTIAAVALPGLGRCFRLGPAIRRQRTPDVVAFLEAPLFVAADVALVAFVRLVELAFSGHDWNPMLLCHYNGNPAASVPRHHGLEKWMSDPELLVTTDSRGVATVTL